MVDKYLNKNILVGLTYLNENGTVQEQVQMHGPIKAMAENTLYFERSDTKDMFSIPFEGTLEESENDLVYELKSTGETVANISFTASFTIYPPEGGTE
ncbi:MAG: hypothetical protein JKY71_11570 [Alphaproteobacteria bacterium]|nr:hypothetical protein [Alphaproteobacteria bacterium]